jgi:excisionase family DNA binding protein
MTTHIRRRLLSIGEASERLGIHINTLRRWADRGMVRTVRLPSGYRRFEEEEIERMRWEMRQRRSEAEHAGAQEPPAGDNAVPPLVARLDATRAAIMRGRPPFDDSTADILRDARDERDATL